MRIAAAAIMTFAAAPCFAQVGGGESGRFPVFGPSEEREAFFAEQEEERQRRLEELREEREAAAQAARERLEREKREVTERRLSRMTLYPVVICEPRDDGEGQECRTVFSPLGLPFETVPRSRTDLDLRFGSGGFGGSLDHAEPGLRLHFGFGEE